MMSGTKYCVDRKLSRALFFDIHFFLLHTMLQCFCMNTLHYCAFATVSYNGEKRQH
jgi:hypothetical protein